MNGRPFLLVGMLVVAGVLPLSAAPYVSLRLRGPHTGTESQWQSTYRAIAANPGCCDEVWFSTGIGVPPLAWHRAQAARIAKAADDLRRIGIVPSLQFQATIGHGDDLSGIEDCSAKDWTGWTGSTGVEDRRCNCPRQPRFLAYVRAVAEIYAAFKPGSVWIDDDLRLDNHLPATKDSLLGCWCATCLGAFNAETGGTWTRETLAKACEDPAVLARWKTFSVASLVGVARAVAEGVHRISPATMLAEQHACDEGSVATVKAVSKALYEVTGRKTGLRPGGGAYYEGDPGDQVVKSLMSAWYRKRLGDIQTVGTWCPEVESWPRAYGSRSAQASVVESFVGFAYGLTSTSLLVMDTRYESDETYSHSLLRPLAEAAVEMTAYAKANEGTEPVGFSWPDQTCEGVDRLYRWALSAIPVLPGCGKDMGALTDADLRMDVRWTASRDVQAKRDELDRRVGGLPAVVESPFVGLMLPRIAADGSLRTVALLNARIDSQGPVILRLRCVPSSVTTLTWHELRKAPVVLPVSRGDGVVRVTIPEISAWNAGYLK